MTAPSPSGRTAGPSGLLVLIVDDNQQNLRLARDVLRAAGVETLEARTGGDALALADEHRPDVILMDLDLPDIDGTDVTRTLGAASRTARIPVVALTAMRLGRADEWLAETGFVGIIEKPFDVRAFPDQVRRYSLLRRR